ncbi:hypothetical protein CANARDRAFT_28510 [[Candida] arabinofermentans NRRL YB-2248]|uniref:Uncharacterized protein n=1 Tax=[Candida] arabinofermentans NRRL YB-2248 TaxID=983967 RepID=A0A1E4T0H4_9ASCO|nr:hypothetical protein CANARDRAFT_28510 [[Candida] arabinofermentans NRRL YB-2248]
MTSTLNNRGPPLSNSPEGTDTANYQSKSLIDLDADFVLKVLYLVDSKTFGPTREAELDLARLFKTLDLNKFFVTVRPDSSSNHLLIFIKLSPIELGKLYDASAKIDSVYGVAPSSTLTAADRLRVVYKKLTNPKSQGGCDITIGTGNWKFVKACIPAANFRDIQKEYINSKSTLAKVFNSEVDAKQSNFVLFNYGSKYALYFKFLGTYSNWLLPLSLIGVLCNSFLGRFSKLFTVLNLFVATGFYLNWYAAEKKLAKDWNSTNISKIEFSRTESKDPTYKVLTRKFAFIPVAIGAALTLVFYQLCCFAIEIFLTELYQGPLKQYLSLIPTILICSIVPVVTAVYTTVVNKYLSFENNPTTSSHHKSFLIKMFTINFLATYMALFITSFIYLPLGFKLNPYLPHLTTYVDLASSYKTYFPKVPIKNEAYEINKMRLNGQFQYFIVTNQIIGLILEFVLPHVMGKVLNHPKLQKLMGQPTPFNVLLNDAPEEVEYLKEIRTNFNMPAYDLDSEYRQLVMQFGFLVLFGPVWSLAPVVCLIFDVFQSKADYIKLIHFAQSPIPDRAESTYPWTLFLKTLLLIGSVTSVCVSLMYNGGDITSSTTSSPVKYSWFVIIPAALISLLSVQTVLYFGEMIIDQYYTDEDKYLFKREKQVEEELEKIESVKSSEVVNNVDDLIKLASAIPKQIAVTNEIQNPKVEKTQEAAEFKQNIDAYVKEGKETVDAVVENGTSDMSHHSYAQLAKPQ